jgi:hypothetical protein
MGPAVDWTPPLTPICSSAVATGVDDEFLAEDETSVAFLVRQRFDTNGTAGILKVTCRFPIAF